MTIDPAIIIAFIGAILALLGLILRSFITGALMSNVVVPRADYEALRVINASYAERFGQQTEAVKALSGAVAALAKPVRR